MAEIIDGKAFAEGLRNRVAQAAGAFSDKIGRKAGLAVVLVGEDPASQIYVRSKREKTVEAGMESFHHELPASTSQAELIALVERLNADDAVDGILVQVPLPDQIDEKVVTNTINPAKDVDGFTFINVGKLAAGERGMVPCTPLGCLMLLKDRIGELSGLDAVVIGRSNIVGKPMAQLLLRESCTVTIAHSRTRNLPDVVRRADILVAAVGRPEMVKGDWLKSGATVIDVGMNRIPREDGKTRLVGDVEFATAAQVAGAITPVPGGVGPMTIAVLLRNCLVAAHARAGLPPPAGL